MIMYVFGGSRFLIRSVFIFFCFLFQRKKKKNVLSSVVVEAPDRARRKAASCQFAGCFSCMHLLRKGAKWMRLCECRFVQNDGACRPFFDACLF